MRQRRSVSLAVVVSAALVVAGVLGWFVWRQLLRGTLAVDAGAVNSSNETEATREIFFYVLDEDLIKLAMDTGDAATPTPLRAQVFSAHPRLGSLAGLMNARRREAYSLSPDVFLLLEQSRPLWEPHVLARARGDERGRARFANLAPGIYWLMAETKTRDSSGDAFWNLQVAVGRGDHHVKLDESNALYFRRPAQ